MRLARPIALFLTIGLAIALGMGAAAKLSRLDAAAMERDGASFVTQPDALQASATRLERGHRGESLTSQRWTKYQPMLLAVVTALLGLVSLSVQRAGAARGVSRPRTSWWFRSGGRAPPYFQLSVV